MLIASNQRCRLVYQPRGVVEGHSLKSQAPLRQMDQDSTNRGCGGQAAAREGRDLKQLFEFGLVVAQHLHTHPVRLSTTDESP